MGVEELVKYAVVEGTGSLVAHLGYKALSKLKSKKQLQVEIGGVAKELLEEIELIQMGLANKSTDEDLDRIESKSKMFLGGNALFWSYAALKVESEFLYNYILFIIGSNHPRFIEVILSQQNNDSNTKTIRLFYDNSIKAADFPLNGQTRENLSEAVHHLRTRYSVPIGFNG